MSRRVRTAALSFVRARRDYIGQVAGALQGVPGPNRIAGSVQSFRLGRCGERLGGCSSVRWVWEG
jgi:hypothetical protein